ncbi:MAG: PEP-CTERM sorting domain-containing protein [Desulfobulbaceae bacterium]|nr:PEP-CTERM sorting domain-containing protein [Desulfobulbaceae bacterium]
MNILQSRLIGCCLAVACLVPAAYADTFTITDYSEDPNAYFGGTATDPTTGTSYPLYSRDTIGGDSKFDVDTLTVSRDNGGFTAVLAGQFFTELEEPQFMGDLFLSNNGWNPYSTGAGDTHYLADTATSGETWEYVLRIVDGEITAGGGVNSGQIALYQVSSTGQIVTSENLTQQGIYRAGQEIQYAPGAGEQALGLGTWALDPTSGTFTFNLDNIDLAMYGLDGEIGLHWTMSCGNDVVEGVVSAPPQVPEPATMLLFGTGLAGLAAYRRRRRQ